MRYKITGETYPIKDTLKSCGCTWDPNQKLWITPYLSEGEPLLAKLKTLCRFSDVQFIPEKLSKQCEKIQEILNRGKK